MKKFLALMLAVLMLCISFAACQSKPATTETESDYDYIAGKGKLVVGITDYAPMDYKEDGSDEWTGFDADFARAVGEELDLDIEFIEIDWDNKFFELDAKAIDCIWNGMTITDEVLLNTSCSKPYAKNEQVVVMKADKAASYTTVESLKDLTFAAEAGSAGESALADNELDCTAVAAQTDALTEVMSGSVDACVIDSTMAGAMTGEGTSYADLATAVSLTKEEYGIAFRKGSDMTEKINDLIDALKEDGTLLAISEKYDVALAD